MVGAVGCGGCAHAARWWAALADTRGWGTRGDCCQDPRALCPSLHPLHLGDSHPTVMQHSTGGSKVTHPRSCRGMDSSSGHLLPQLLQSRRERRGKPGQNSAHESGGAAREVIHSDLLGLKGCFCFWRGHETMKCSCQLRRD